MWATSSKKNAGNEVAAADVASCDWTVADSEVAAADVTVAVGPWAPVLAVPLRHPT